MARLIQKTKILVVLLVFVATFSANATATRIDVSPFANQQQNKAKIINFGYGFHVDLYIIFGFGYIFNCSTDFSHFKTPFSMSTPVGFGVDFRFVEWFSIFSSLNFQYELQSFSWDESVASGTKSTQTFYNNLQISLPVMIKFYPFVYKSDNYERMFFAAGLVAHFSPARFYKSVAETFDTNGNSVSTETFYGDVLRGAEARPFPSSCYVPANVGIRLSMGNTFIFKGKAGIGLEFFVQHLFIPTINGYLATPSFKINDTPFLDFNLTLGFTFSIAINAYNSQL